MSKRKKKSPGDPTSCSLMIIAQACAEYFGTQDCNRAHGYNRAQKRKKIQAFPSIAKSRSDCGNPGSNLTANSSTSSSVPSAPMMIPSSPSSVFSCSVSAGHFWYGLDESQRTQLNLLLENCVNTYLKDGENWILMLSSAKSVLVWAKKQYELSEFSKARKKVRYTPSVVKNSNSSIDNMKGEQSAKLQNDKHKAFDTNDEYKRCIDIFPFGPSAIDDKVSASVSSTSVSDEFKCTTIFDNNVRSVKKQPVTLPLVVPIPRGRVYSPLITSQIVRSSSNFTTVAEYAVTDKPTFTISELPLSGPDMRMIWLLHSTIIKRDQETRQLLTPMLQFYFQQLWEDAMNSLPVKVRVPAPSLSSVLRLLIAFHQGFTHENKDSGNQSESPSHEGATIPPPNDFNNCLWRNSSVKKKFSKPREFYQKSRATNSDVSRSADLSNYLALPYAKLWCRMCHTYCCNLHPKDVPEMESNNEPRSHVALLQPKAEMEMKIEKQKTNIAKTTCPPEDDIKSVRTAIVDSLSSSFISDEYLRSCFGVGLVWKTLHVADNNKKLAAKILGLSCPGSLDAFSECIDSRELSVAVSNETLDRNTVESVSDSDAKMYGSVNDRVPQCGSYVGTDKFAPQRSNKPSLSRKLYPATVNSSISGQLSTSKHLRRRGAVVFNEDGSTTGKRMQRQYMPCNHDGPCSEANRTVCACVQRDTFCEKYCGCSSMCVKRFQGCQCVTGCQRSTCPCTLAGRECDADLCKTCLAHDPEKNLRCLLHGGEGPVCHNMPLQLGLSARVKIGRSNTHGWGCFSVNDLPKGAHLMEYVGEIIDPETADKRGAHYDKQGTSFLFALNADQVVDATKFGSRSKFINHSCDPNVNVQIVLVNGQHRIKMSARRHISSGEELCFDYGYESDVAPLWAKREYWRRRIGNDRGQQRTQSAAEERQ